MSAAWSRRNIFVWSAFQTIRDINEVHDPEAPGGQKPGFTQDLDAPVLVKG
jgi:hypothetical protein